MAFEKIRRLFFFAEKYFTAGDIFFCTISVVRKSLAYFFKIGYNLFIMVVRMRHTRAQRGNTRSHHRLENPAVTSDKNTGVPHLRHRASLVTGKYNGRQVIDVQAKLDKAAKKAKARENEGR